MLGEGAVVNEITGLFCNINEPLGLSLKRLPHLLMAAVGKGVKLLASVASVDGVVRTVGMDWEGTGTYIPYVLRVNDTANCSF